MQIELTLQQKKAQEAFKSFVNEEIIPHADNFDREENIPPELIQKLALNRYFGSLLPVEWGGSGIEVITYGLLQEEFGRGCSAVRSLLTAHDMVAQVILKWGSKHQKECWLRKLANGEIIAAFGLTEPNIGSDARSVETIAVRSGNSYILNGHKKWVTSGQIADLFLIIARCEGKPTAFVAERNNPGFSTRPISGMLGVRGSMLAELHLNECKIPKENLIGRVGSGFSSVASTALDHGRYSVAWGCVGIAQACLEACVQYTNERKQFGAYLKDHQLIRNMITEMITNVKAARLLCYNAGYLKSIGEPRAVMETSIAKYFASRMATKVALDAVQIHGANGCSSEYSVQRHLRDAKIMEIIEGSTQIHQLKIAEYAQQEYASIKD